MFMIHFHIIITKIHEDLFRNVLAFIHSNNVQTEMASLVQLSMMG